MAITFATSPGRTSGPFHVHLPSAGPGSQPLTRSTYVRRRIGALTFVVALVLSVGSMAQHGLADRGGDPASVSAIGRSVTYVVQPGDTLWSIAERCIPAPTSPLVVDALVSLNGGTVARHRPASAACPDHAAGDRDCRADALAAARLARHALSPMSCRRHQGDRFA